MPGTSPTRSRHIAINVSLSRLRFSPLYSSAKIKPPVSPLVLDTPLTVTGLDEAPDEIRESVAASIVAHGAAYIGSKPLGGEARWIQVVDDVADASADAVVFNADSAIAAGAVTRDNPQQPAGLVVKPANVEAAVDFALEQTGRLDVLVNNAGGSPEVEAATASPRFTDAIIRLNLVGPAVLIASG